MASNTSTRVPVRALASILIALAIGCAPIVAIDVFGAILQVQQ